MTKTAGLAEGGKTIPDELTEYKLNAFINLRGELLTVFVGAERLQKVFSEHVEFQLRLTVVKGDHQMRFCRTSVRC